MTTFTKIDLRDLKVPVEEEQISVEFSGFVSQCHHTKKVTFLHLYRDSVSRLSPVMCVCSADKLSEDDPKTPITSVRIYWSITVQGILKKAKPGPKQKFEFEVEVSTFKVESKPQEDFMDPLMGTGYDMEHIQKFPHLTGSHQVSSAIATVSARSITAFDEFFASKRVKRIFPKLLVEGTCEGGCAMFSATTLLDEPDTLKKMLESKESIDSVDQIDFTKDLLKRRLLLTATAQPDEEQSLHMGDVYVWTPASRAERSISAKHLATFTMLEYELLFVDLKDLIKFTEEMLKFTIKKLASDCKKEIQLVGEFFGHSDAFQQLEKALTTPFIIKRHDELIQELLESGKEFTIQPDYSKDLASEHEKAIMDMYEQQTVVVTHFPRDDKAFYMPDEKEPTHGVMHVDCFDILVRGGVELVGGSPRVKTYEEFMKKMADFQIPPETQKGMIDAYKAGLPPHGGMGMGFERFLQYVLFLPSVRYATPFPVSCRE